MLALVAEIESMGRELDALRQKLVEAEKRAESAEKREALTEASNCVLRRQIETMGPALLRAQADRAAVSVAMDRLMSSRSVDEAGAVRGIGSVERIGSPGVEVEEGVVRA